MKSIDLTPLYRSSVGFDHSASLLNSVLGTHLGTAGQPAHDIEVIEDNRYLITLAVAGMDESDIDIRIESGALFISGKKKDRDAERNYLYQGIVDQDFECKFNLAEFVEVTGAELENGLLKIHLFKQVPDSLKPRTIPINSGGDFVDHETARKSESKKNAA